MNTTELVCKYENDGLLDCVEVLAPERAGYYAKRYRQFIETYRDHPDYPKWTYGKAELLLGWVVELAAEKALLDVIAALLGPNILLWNAFLPAKAPKTAGFFGWHQDATYWPVAPTSRIVSAWVAVCTVNSRNGGMRMVRGSHHAGPVPHEKTFNPKSMLRRGQQAEVDADSPNISHIDLAAGQASFHHPMTLHCSGPNESDDWRLGVALSYAAADVSPLPGYTDSAMLLRGSPGNTRFVLDESPDGDMSASALALFEEAALRQQARYADISATD